MAATSVANLIKEFSDKPIPNLEALRQSFQPSTPDQWLKRMEASNEDAMAEQDSSMEETDTEAPVELFYDIDANDDDLKAFLGDSDEESVVQQPSVSQTTAISKRKSTIAPKKLVDKVISAARKSLAPIAQATRESEDADLESPPGSKTVVTKRASSTSAVDDGSQHGSQVRISGTDGRRGTADSANEKRGK
ncbi:uncharacterized protein LOC118434842 [Folsomia candida]|uniref:uncharacterized protein LOC118434842 n=1 Tax=Folsomia candida TaxID=158441 RepID=UPI001604F3E1|nr:uncharacterized protein LOC118434842 [Folsomia candida]